MATVVRGTIPAAEFALYETLRSVEAVEFEAERIVETGDETVMPLTWARGTDAGNIEDALDGDQSVEDRSRLASFDSEHLYRMEWGRRLARAPDDREREGDDPRRPRRLVVPAGVFPHPGFVFGDDGLL